MSRRVLLWLLTAAAVAGLAVLLGWAVWRVPQALYDYVPDPKDRAGVEATTRTGLIAGLAGLAALGSLALTTRTYRLTQQGQLTDRYTKAIEQLGNDKLDVRLGGIYALERIAVDSKRDHPTIVEVLSAYVRERTAPVWLVRPGKPHRGGGDPAISVLGGHTSRRRRQPQIAHPPMLRKQAKLGVDVQAALTVLGRLPQRSEIARANLSRANLTGANLVGANLARANLGGANLTKAELSMANLSMANLVGADLTGAELVGADLTKAELGEANLTGAGLLGAELTEAHLVGADLTKAQLLRADLTGADLSSANLTEAVLFGSDLTRAKVRWVKGLSLAQLTDVKGLTEAPPTS